MNVDVCVIGTGPAGLSAATMLARHGQRVVIVDESPTPGGRLAGQLHRLGRRNDDYHRDGWWNGKEIAAQLAQEAVTAGAILLQGHSVWGIFPGWKVCVSGDRAQIIHAAQVVITTGAMEVAFPIPGWTIPGVMSIGAGQVMATQHRLRPGKTGIVVGVNALSLAIANELRMSGMEIVAAVNLPAGPLIPDHQTPAEVIADLARSSHLAPNRIFRVSGRLGTNRHIATLAARLQPKNGIRVWGIPINPRQTVTEIHGVSEVEAVTVADLGADGEIRRTRRVAVDSVFLAAGLRPISDVASMTGCQFIDIAELGGMVPLHGPGLETTVAGVYVAGNATGIESALVAMAQGRLAAASIVEPDRIDVYRADVARASKESPIAFLPNISHGRDLMRDAWMNYGRTGTIDRPTALVKTPPPASLKDLPGNLIVCRCEDVTIDAIRTANANGAMSAEELKRYTRMTMGTCQGRICQGILGRIECAFSPEHQRPASLPGHRPPVRPVHLGEMASLAEGNEEWERLHGNLVPSQPFDEPGAEVRLTR